MWIAALLALPAVSGCAQMDKLKQHFSRHADTHTSVVFTPTVQPREPVASASDVSLAAIVSDQLQHGHFAEGERALRRHLAQHPGDRPAQAMLRQLTVDPEQMLGHRWRSHVVVAGDSYSALAAHYLGDPSLFVVLARYNHASNPSVLRLGDKLRLPLNPPDKDHADRATAAEMPAGSLPSTAAEKPPAAETSTMQAARLQQESLALLDQGQPGKAMARLDQALLVDPKLPPNGPTAVNLRRKLVDSYHQRAIVLYRDQQLDQAITLWDRALAIDATFEPAIVYRARALELKRRLKQF